MNKVLLTLAAAALAVSASAQVHHETRVVTVSPAAVQAQSPQKVARIASNQRWAGLYTSDALAEYGLGVPTFPGDLKAGAYLTADMMNPYVGKKIVGMRVGLSYALPIRPFIAKASGSLTSVTVSDELWGQDLASTQVGWNEVSLSSPIDITTGQGYLVGFDYTQKNTPNGQYYTEDCYPLSCVEEGNTDNALWIYTNIPASQNGHGTDWYGFSANGRNLSVQLLVEGDFAEYDVNPTDFVSATGAVNKTCDIDITFANSSKEAVSNIDYVVTVDGVAGEEQHTNLRSKVAVGSTGKFTATVDCGSEVKTREVSIEVTKVNGHENQSSNKVSKGQLVVVSKIFKRGVVVEEFTGTGCGFCPRGLVGMEKLATNYPDNFVGIGIHQFNSSDPMYTSNYASLGFSGAPSCMIDRSGTTMDPYYGAIGESITEDFEAAMKVVPMVGVNVSGLWNSDSTTVTVNATVESYVAGSYEIAYVLVADDLEGTGSSWRQGNYFYQYEQSQVPDDLKLFARGGSKGTSTFQWAFDDVLISSSYNRTTNMASKIQLTQNGTTTASYEVAMPTKAALKKAINKKKVAVIAMVLDADGHVMNAAKSYNITAATGIQGVNGNANTSLKEVARYNAAGQRIYAPVKGLNLVKMSDGTTVKVIVK